MANIDTWYKPALNPRMAASGMTPIAIKITVPASGIANADVIRLRLAGAGDRYTGMQLRHSATLGASCTLQLRIGSTALTAASTAGGASGVIQNAVAAPANGTDTLNILVGGANIAASADVEVTGFEIHSQS